jgi:drug/metabolite transporter (DMT)-like permease
VAAQPGLTLTDPIVSILWGVLAFHEQVRGGWFAVAGAASGLIVVAAVVVLARSPTLADQPSEEQSEGQHDRDASRSGRR